MRATSWPCKVWCKTRLQRSTENHQFFLERKRWKQRHIKWLGSHTYDLQWCFFNMMCGYFFWKMIQCIMSFQKAGKKQVVLVSHSFSHNVHGTLSRRTATSPTAMAARPYTPRPTEVIFGFASSWWRARPGGKLVSSQRWTVFCYTRSFLQFITLQFWEQLSSQVSFPAEKPSM